jgi:MoaA/NifB/PqqE/SkfB family radical SAM enzyme
MEITSRAAYDAKRDFGNKAFRSGCYAPYVSMYFTSVGDVIACCKNQSFVLGNVQRDRLKDIWNGAKTNQLRKALLDYRFEAGCDFCEWQITEGNYDGSFPRLFEDFTVSAERPEWPAMIEFAGSNTCNFECLMCYGELSSSIRAHRDGLPPLPKYYGEEFFTDLAEFLPHLKRAKFLGGEPFLASETLRIWEMMIEQHLEIPCHVTTNASQYNTRVEKILNNLPVSITVSIDGATRETFESIRLNSNYTEVMNNVRRFRDYTRRRGTYFGIAFCLMRQNWHEFVDVLLLADELDCEVFVNTVLDPASCSIYTLNSEERQKIAAQLQNHAVMAGEKLRRNKRTLMEILEKMEAKAEQEDSARTRRALEATWNTGMTLALQLAGQGRLEEALTVASGIPENHVNYYHSVTFCGEVRRLLGDLKGAERDLNQALKISSRRPEALVYLAKLRLDQNRPEEALKIAQQARLLLPKEKSLESDLSQILSAARVRLEESPKE